MTVLKTRQGAPKLSVPTLNGSWSLENQNPEHFTMIVFYRGLHCPLCQKYLAELDGNLEQFTGAGVSVIAISSDNQNRTELTVESAKLNNLEMGYDLTVEQAQQWGLHRSEGRGKTSIGIEEPTEFSEPGLFLVKPDGTLYWSNISTMPFARPNFKEILGAIKFVLANDYPARGELV